MGSDSSQVLQFEEIRFPNPFFTVSLDKVVETSLRRRQLDLGHEQWLVELYSKNGPAQIR